MAPSALALYLTYVSDDSVQFMAHIDGDISRKVSVQVGSGLVLFPHHLNDTGASLGNPYDDEHVRWRAYEELARLRCYRFDAA